MPAGWFMKAWNFDPVAAAAAPDIFDSEVRRRFLEDFEGKARGCLDDEGGDR